MNLSQLFIQRPIFAVVLSLLILIDGAISLSQLLISEHPGVVSPTAVVRANFPGANPKVIGETIASPLEQAITGVENMLYMSSQSTSDGKLTLTIIFALGTDLDNAQVQVQDRITRTELELPEEVTRLGITVDKVSSDLTMVVHLTSPDNRYNMFCLSNYAVLDVKDELTCLDGVGDVQLFGLGDYSLRVWLDPNKVVSRNLTATDVANAIREQNRQVAADTLGAPPAPSDTSFRLSINTQGRLVTEGEFENIITRVGANGEITHLRDIARVELGFNQYALRLLLNNKPAVVIPILQRSSSNAVEISNLVRKKMAELKHSSSQGMDYSIVYDPTIFVYGSIEAAVHILLEVLVLVALVVILFLQTWHASIIPLVTVPVSLIGTFVVMHMLGFLLSALPLFDLVLATDIVVDDAIVMVENVERDIGLSLKSVEATKCAMREVVGPTIVMALVLCTVFIPIVFISGFAGQFHRQFVLIIAISTVILAFNSLTLSPALATVLLKGHHEPKDRFSVFFDRLLGSWLFRPFNRFFNRASHGYVGMADRVLRGSSIALLVYGRLMVLIYFGFSSASTGFIPQQDKQYLVAFAQLPDAASLDRIEAMIKQISEIALAQPGVADSIAFPDLSINGSTNSSNSDIVFTPLKPFDERKDPSQSAGTIAAALSAKYVDIQDVYIATFPSPPAQGLGIIGGFRPQIEDRGNQGYEELPKQTQNTITKARALPELGPSSAFSSYQVNVPQIDADIDREKAKTYGVTISDVFDALQVYLDLLYANDFNRFGRTYQTNVQTEQQLRLESEQTDQLKVRNSLGEMVPLASFIKVSDTSGPGRVMHYNGSIAAELNGASAAGYSSSQVQATIGKLLKEELPNGIAYEWTELTYQQILAGNTTLLVFPLCVLLAFSMSAAQHENWNPPPVVILIVSMTLLSAIIGVILAGSDNNIFTQIGLIVPVGPTCKNMILTAEFAKDKQEEGIDRVAAVLEACRLRLWPILMTSTIFIMGVVPLAISIGAGVKTCHAMGVVVLFGIIGVTSSGLLPTPVFYILTRHFVENRETRRAANDKGLSEVHA